MKFAIVAVILCTMTIGQVMAGGPEIVAAARTQIGVPYSWGGGGWAGKALGIEQGANTVGFDCSGLAQYSVYLGTGKKIARVSREQYLDSQCKHVPYDEHLPGDLVFFDDGGQIHHVGIISGHGIMINAPQTGELVKEVTVREKGRVAFVQRCW